MDIIDIAEEYYTLLGKKDASGVAKYLHEDVLCISPVDEVRGKRALLGVIKNFVSSFNSLNIRNKFCSENQAVVVFDLNFPEPIGKLRSVSLVTFEDGLIKQLELFYDSGQIAERTKKEICS